MLGEAIEAIKTAKDQSNKTRRFPPRWSIEESAACFIVRKGDKQTLAYVYFENEPGRRSTAKLLTLTRYF